MGDIFIATGYVGADPDSKFLAQGDQVTTFSLALNRGWGDKKKTVWTRITCWRKLAETVAQYVTKGKLVEIYGEVQPPRIYQAKDGTWKAGNLEVTAHRVNFLGGKGDAPAPQEPGAGVTEIEDDPLPF